MLKPGTGCSRSLYRPTLWDNFQESEDVGRCPFPRQEEKVSLFRAFLDFEKLLNLCEDIRIFWSWFRIKSKLFWLVVEPQSLPCDLVPELEVKCPLFLVSWTLVSSFKESEKKLTLFSKIPILVSCSWKYWKNISLSILLYLCIYWIMVIKASYSILQKLMIRSISATCLLVSAWSWMMFFNSTLF